MRYCCEPSSAREHGKSIRRPHVPSRKDKGRKKVKRPKPTHPPTADPELLHLQHETQFATSLVKNRLNRRDYGNSCQALAASRHQIVSIPLWAGFKPNGRPHPFLIGSRRLTSQSLLGRVPAHRIFRATYTPTPHDATVLPYQPLRKQRDVACCFFREGMNSCADDEVTGSFN